MTRLQDQVSMNIFLIRFSQHTNRQDIQSYKCLYHSNRGEREFPFTSILGNESLKFPFPNHRNKFFIPFPFPNFGYVFFIPIPVPNWGDEFYSFLARFQIYHFADGNHIGNWNIAKDIRLSIFSASSTFLKTISIEEVNPCIANENLPCCLTTSLPLLVHQ